MPALRTNDAPPQRRGPQRLQQQGSKKNSSSEAMAVLPSSAAPLSKRSAGRSGPRRGRVPVAQKAVKKPAGAGNGVNAAGNKAGESCAWPAYARGAKEAEAEALSAVRSLYADELKPFGRILRKRVAERILEGNGEVASITKLDALPEVDAKQVRAVCESCDLFHVEEEDGGDWSAVLVDHPANFVDVYSPADGYHPQLWSGLRMYCESSAGKDLSLPGGRYACAQALKALQLPLLRGFSLGRICHIVQLAISQKKILGYMNGAVVPYARSQSMMKEQCAMYGQPTTGNGNGQNNLAALPIASLEDTRKYVHEILDTAKGEAPLSNIKRLFRSRYQIELSETSFGYSKLSELLQGPNFSDICRVELRGHGYTVIQTGPSPSTPLLMTATFLDNGPRRVALCADEPLAFDDVDALEGTPMVLVPTPTPTPVTGPAARRWCLSPSKDGGDNIINYSVQHTFLQYKVPQTPLPGPKRRSHSLPKDMGRGLPLASETCSAEDKLATARTCRSLSKASHESESTADGSGTECLRKKSSHKRTDSSSSAEVSSDEASFGYVPQLPGMFWGRTPGTTPLPSPVPRAPVATATSGLASQFPTALASLCGRSLGTMHAEDETGSLTPRGNESSMHRVALCPDEPLGFDEAAFFPTSPKASPKPSPFPTLSPAVVPPTPSPLPLYNYAETAPWRRYPMCSSVPQPHPTFIATAPSCTELGCLGGFAAGPAPQPVNVCTAALQAPQPALQPGCILRLGEYL